MGSPRAGRARDRRSWRDPFYGFPPSRLPVAFPEGPMRALFPLFLKLEGRDVLVVGAGSVAERKIVDLVAAGAHARVVAPEATEAVKGLAERGEIAWEARAFEERDLDGAWLVIAATSDAEAQRRAAEGAEARRVFVIAVDDLPN